MIILQVHLYAIINSILLMARNVHNQSIKFLSKVSQAVDIEYTDLPIVNTTYKSRYSYYKIVSKRPG